MMQMRLRLLLHSLNATDSDAEESDGEDLLDDDDGDDRFDEEVDLPERSAIGKFDAALAVLRALMAHDELLAQNNPQHPREDGRARPPDDACGGRT